MGGILKTIWNALSIGAEESRPPDDHDFWYEVSPSSASSAGVVVTPDTAMRVSAVAACVRIISESVAALPLIVHERDANSDDKKRAPNHPLYRLLKDQPNRWQTSFEWREMMQAHVLLRGNAYSEIVPGPRGFADQLVPLHPDRVRPVALTSGEVYYVYTMRDGQQRIISDEQMFHLRGLSSDMLVGRSPIHEAREAIGLSIAMESYGGRFFSQNARPGGVLETPKILKKDQVDRLKKSWQDAHAGVGNAHRVAVLEDGLKWTAMGLSNEDSQFLETRAFQRSEIAMIFRIPPHMIGDLAKSTSWGTGIEQQSIGFVVYTLLPWLRRWEQAITKDLILAKDKYFAEFLVEGLLRGDLNSRYAAYAIGRQWGWLSRNDVRRLENMNRIEGGDDYLVPMNMSVLGEEEEIEVVETPTGALPPAPEEGEEGEEGESALASLHARREVSALNKAVMRSMERDEFLEWTLRFYNERPAYLQKTLGLSLESAIQYARESRDEVIAHLQSGGNRFDTEFEASRRDALLARIHGRGNGHDTHAE